MKIFLGWSGPVALKVATLLWEFLPRVLPYAQPWVSEEDIAKGTVWNAELWTNLREAKFGIICVVPGTASETWISFEAGALACASAADKVSPFILGLEPEDLPGTLKQFQCTKANLKDTLRLIKRIHSVSSESNLDPETVERVFRANWGKLRDRLRKVDLSPPPSAEISMATAEPADEPDNELAELDALSLQILTTLATALGPGLSAFGVHLRIPRPQQIIKLRLLDLYKLGLVNASSSNIDLAWFSVTEAGIRLLDEKRLL